MGWTSAFSGLAVRCAWKGSNCFFILCFSNINSINNKTILISFIILHISYAHRLIKFHRIYAFETQNVINWILFSHSSLCMYQIRLLLQFKTLQQFIFFEIPCALLFEKSLFSSFVLYRIVWIALIVRYISFNFVFFNYFIFISLYSCMADVPSSMLLRFGSLVSSFIHKCV